MNKKIRILLDHQIFSIQTFGGISRVHVELYKRFIKDSSIDCKIPILFSENDYIKDILKVHSFFKANNSFLKKLFYYLINEIYSIYKLIKGNFDIFVPTYYDPYFLPFLRNKPFVLLIHDMTHEIFPESVSLKDRTIEWKRKLVYKADKIIAISENTKKDIIKFYGIDKDKIEVVNWATSFTTPQKEIKVDLPQRYILYVGNRGIYKNFNNFFKAVAPILLEKNDLFLVCEGSSSFSREEIDMIINYGLEDRVKHIRYKDDDELGYIYNHAICFVFPSLYEGFGIPVLESFACECPAIVSNTSSLPEVGGDAVEYFDPTDIKSIESSVKKVVEDKILRENMIKKGKDRLKFFSWEKSSNSFISIYKKMLK